MTPTEIAPPAGVAFADRSRSDPGMVHGSDDVVAAFAAIGWTWGGSWTSIHDYQHFERSAG